MPAGYDGVGSKIKKSWAMKVKPRAGSKVGPKGGSYSRKSKIVTPAKPKKPPRQQRSV